MYCPFCTTPSSTAEDTKVIDSRLSSDGSQVRRRRECVSCNERFTTFETAELLMPQVIKRDARRKPFDEEKLRTGMRRALEKRPVALDDIEIAIHHLKQRIRSFGEREIHTKLLGEWVMEELRELDQVAYVRFASVYRRFQDVSEFKEAIINLEE